MKKLIKWLLVIVVLVGLFLGIYKVFINVDKTSTIYTREFKLKKYDVARISDEVTVKLMSVKDDRCEQIECTKSNEQYATILIYNSNELRFLTLSTVSNTTETIERMDNLIVELINISDDGIVTLKLDH
jgi:hypothetical protein